MLSSQILEYFESNNLFTSTQHGFRQNMSCESAIHSILDHWLHMAQKSKIIVSLFIDFKKAFDTVDPKQLHRKLFHYGFDNCIQWRQLLFLLLSFYSFISSSHLLLSFYPFILLFGLLPLPGTVVFLSFYSVFSTHPVLLSFYPFIRSSPLTQYCCPFILLFLFFYHPLIKILEYLLFVPLCRWVPVCLSMWVQF